MLVWHSPVRPRQSAIGMRVCAGTAGSRCKTPLLSVLAQTVSDRTCPTSSATRSISPTTPVSSSWRGCGRQEHPAPRTIPMNPLTLAAVRKHTGRHLTYAEAITLANPGDPFLRNIAVALSLHTWNNTAQDWLRRGRPRDPPSQAAEDAPVSTPE